MSGLLSHTLFLLALSVPIVVMGAFYSHADDGPALRSIPKRYGFFVVSCAAVAGLMLLCAWLFASVD